MHTALIASLPWLSEAVSTFRQLVVGMIDEQVRVAQVFPEGFSPEEASIFGERVVWQDSPWPWVRRRQQMRLGKSLKDMGVNVLHALDGRRWEAAARIGQCYGMPVVLGAWSLGDIERLSSYFKGSRSPSGLGVLAASEPLGRAARDLLGPRAAVEVARPGVYAAKQPRPAYGPERPLGVLVTGGERFGPEYDTLMRTLRRLRKDYPEAMFFFDGGSSDQHRLWRMGQRFGLLANLSLLPPDMGLPEQLRAVDVLVHPQSPGRVRPLLLGAMAQGIPVISRPEPWVDWLIHDQTACLIQEGTAKQWEKALRWVLGKPDEAHALATSAWEYVREYHRPSRMVEQTLSFYRRVSEAPYRFPDSPAPLGSASA
jgi:glycosyltransferase involved in cell wall biosynthesis